MDKLPYQIQYFCPGCGRGNYDILPDHLDTLPCCGCGMLIDCTASEIRVVRTEIPEPSPVPAVIV